MSEEKGYKFDFDKLVLRAVSKFKQDLALGKWKAYFDTYNRNDNYHAEINGPIHNPFWHEQVSCAGGCGKVVDQCRCPGLWQTRDTWCKDCKNNTEAQRVARELAASKDAKKEMNTASKEANDE